MGIKLLINPKWLCAGLLLACLFSTSCKKYMDGLNSDQKLLSDELLQIDATEGGFLLPGMMTNILSNQAWLYEFEQDLSVDRFAGYLSSSTVFYGGFENSTYSMNDDWNAYIWQYPSTNTLDQWVLMKKKGFATKYSDLYSIALILKAIVGHRLVDIFGPFPYSHYGDSSVVQFDSEEEAYNSIFIDLKTAADTLSRWENFNPAADQTRFKRFDRSVFGGDYAKWMRLANTLRLRLAMRISKVNPVKAQQEAEAAVAAGVLESADGSLAFPSSSGHPLATSTAIWGNSRLGAPIGTFLSGFSDPRLPKYALPATDPGFAGEFIGVRTGIDNPLNASYGGFSIPNFASNPPIKLVDVAESYFLRAEGVLKGWSMGTGTAQEFYENGIAASFTENGVSGLADYLNNSTGKQTAYTDPKNPANNSAPLSSITVKWDESASADEKLERIITQKWIALYPEGAEAWSEFRRTGYPKLYPVVVNNSGGKVPAGTFIKRLAYPSAVVNASKSAATDAISKYLDGNDSPGTPIWWMP